MLKEPNEFIGLLYPVTITFIDEKSEETSIPGTRKILYAFRMEDVAGYCFALESINDPYAIVSGYKEVIGLPEKQEELKKLPNFGKDTMEVVRKIMNKEKQ